MNMLKMMQQFKQIKKLQKELARQTYEATSTSKQVTVVAKGDMSIQSLSIAPEAMDSGPNSLAREIISTANSALDSAKKGATGEMSKMAGGLGGIADMLGG